MVCLMLRARFVLLALLPAALLLLPACTGSPTTGGGGGGGEGEGSGAETLKGTKWTTGDDKNKETIEFAESGEYIYKTKSGDSEVTAKGKYTIVDDGNVEIEIVFPEEVYKAQKAAYDEAKKAYDQIPAPPIGSKPAFAMPEPVKELKGKNKVNVSDDEMTMTVGGKDVKYKKVK